MNLDFFGMFDFIEGDSDIYEYTSAEWSKLIEALSGTGVTKDSFVTTANGLSLTVSKGVGFINGRYCYNTSSKTLTLDACSNTLSRIDRIVLQLDVQNRKISLEVVKGSASGTPIVPGLTQANYIYQIPLYQAKITNGSTVTLTDERQLCYTPTEAGRTAAICLDTVNQMVAGTKAVYACYA